MYYENAQAAYSAGNFPNAKRNFLLAAETMYKLAKMSTGNLQKSRMDRAKRLIEMAENIGKKPIPKVKGPEPSEKEEDTGKQWETAEIPNISFDDIAGLEDVKKAITLRMIYPLKYPDKYKTYNKKTGGGVLLYGPPGTGKTMIAKAIAYEVNAKFYTVKCSDVISKWVGDSEKNINSLFETAKKDDLAIIFFDELDGLFGTRGKDIHNDKRVGEFLQQIDGFSGRSTNLLILGATNRPWDVDKAALRPGRFSQSIYVPLPDEKAREFLFRKSLEGVPLKDVNIEDLISLTEGYSGADIDELCDRAKEQPLIDSIKHDSIINITMQDFKYALKAVRPSVDKESLKEYEKYINNLG
ncbi:aaa domain-containing [Holotrichia oblita]|nr:aaa domain-containing [Holotrichia oblita]